tara:strand:- start:133 stop:342 length:210 start_codon:yes stop_codon:yes gene_type:complete
LEVCTRSGKIQVGDPDNVDTRRGPCLSEIHRGEFPAADNGNADRLVPGLTFLQQVGKIHRLMLRNLFAA